MIHVKVDALNGYLVERIIFKSGTGIRVTSRKDEYSNGIILTIDNTGGGGSSVGIWHNGSGAPGTLYSDDDFYLDSSNGDVYLQVAGVWTLVGSLVGGGGSGDSLLIPYVATANIAIYDVVTSTGVVANSATTAHRNKIIGIATAAVLSGFSGNVIGFGKITNAGWSWTIGDRIFLNGTTLSTTAPSTGFIQIIGTAIASDTIDVKLAQSILL